MYRNLRFISGFGRGEPQGKRQDNRIAEMVTWQLMSSVSQPPECSLVLDDKSFLPMKVLLE